MKIPPHERLTLSNGVRLILLPAHEVPLIAFEAAVRGGCRLDPAGYEGVGSLAAELLTHGAGERDAYAFADAVEGAGGSLDADAHREATIVHGQFLARDRELLLELLADALLRPHFDATELDKLRERRIEGIRAAKDSDPQSLLGTYGRGLLFGAHPYGKPGGGSEASLAAVGRDAVLRLYREHFGADRLTLVFAGDFDPGSLKDAVARRFEALRPAGAALPPLAAPARAVGRRVLLIDSPGSEQSYFWIGNVGVARAYALRAALDVTNTAFGGSFGSMLMQALRVRTGLTYSAYASFRRGSVPGEFAIHSFTQTDSTRRALDIALETLRVLKRRGVAAAAIDSARSYILGQYPLGFETAADWAAALADLELYELPQSYIDEYDPALRRVDARQVREVTAAAFPEPDDVDIALIGDAARIRSEAAAFGSVLETTLAAPSFAASSSTDPGMAVAAALDANSSA
ncbi:MAG TPA: pitrilysin family protein [Steroidobacteraceae bacterium]|nr:pitrilysin family protein [Steroidobacteraceae bacterium]